MISIDDFIDDNYNTSAGSSEYARMHSGEFMLLFLGNIFLKCIAFLHVCGHVLDHKWALQIMQ